MTVETDETATTAAELPNGTDQQPQQQQQQNQQQPLQQKSKQDKNKRKKARKKLSKQRRRQPNAGDHSAADNSRDRGAASDEEDDDDDIVVEYVFEEPAELLTDVRFRHFRKIFQAFRPVSEDPASSSSSSTSAPAAGGSSSSQSLQQQQQAQPTGLAQLKSRAAEPNDDDDDEDDGADPDRKHGREDDEAQKLSKRKLKKLTRMSVAELKQVVDRPEVVEMHDVCARDPKLLCHLKAYRNSVPVPRHWCAKRKYLQGKRGIEKAPFQLPDFIKATGIMEMRETGQEKDDAKTMKQKMRERVRPKVGKIDIDYQKLHDAFFKFQVKPPMTGHGDLYYEGREFETRLRAKKPGALSDDLRTALGMPVGPGCDRFPPPWLIAMQRYGPPPAFPNLRIAGLNAPIPEGCSFGYHAGGWGKPPVDAHGRPIYGDVFGHQQQQQQQQPVQAIDAGPQAASAAPVDRRLWGELESESESSEASDEDDDGEEEDEDEDDDEEGGADDAAAAAAGAATPSGALSSATPAGLETPDMIELRKQRIQASVEAAMDRGDGEEPAAYRVLPEVHTTSVGDAFLGSAKVYDVSGVAAAAGPAGTPAAGGAAGGAASSGGAVSSSSRKRTRAEAAATAAAAAAAQSTSAAAGVSAAKKYAKDYKF